MAIIKYGKGASAPATAGRGMTPARTTRATPARVTPARGQKPQLPGDVDAGAGDAGGFVINAPSFGSTGGGTGGASTTNAKITTGYKVATDKAAAARNRSQAAYIRQMLGLAPGQNPAVGAYDQSITDLLGKVDTEEARQLGDVRSLYGTVGTGGAAGTGLRGDVQKAYGTATGQVTAGYDALRTWLQNNAPRAYANAPRATATPVDNALAAYQRAQGVSSAPVDAQVAAMNVAAGGGASNYNNLLGVLAAASNAAQESRLAEEGMARLGTGNALTAAQTAALANLATQQATAENAVRGQFGQTRLSAEQARIQRQQGLEDLLRGLVGY
jgi:hypothetical protein